MPWRIKMVSILSDFTSLLSFLIGPGPYKFSGIWITINTQRHKLKGVEGIFFTPSNLCNVESHPSTVSLIRSHLSELKLKSISAPIVDFTFFLWEKNGVNDSYREWCKCHRYRTGIFGNISVFATLVPKSPNTKLYSIWKVFATFLWQR